MAGEGGIPVVVSKADLYDQGARLGSASKYSATGHVFFMDDFGHGLGAWRLTGTTISWIAGAAGNSKDSGFACRLNRTVADCSIFRQDPPFASRWGLEITWKASNDIMQLACFMGYLHNGRSEGAYFYCGAGVVAIWTAGPTLITLPNSNILSFDVVHTAKIVADPARGRLYSLQVDNTTWDLNAYGLVTAPQAWAVPNSGCCYTYIATATNNGILDISHVILTDSE